MSFDINPVKATLLGLVVLFIAVVAAIGGYKLALTTTTISATNATPTTSNTVDLLGFSKSKDMLKTNSAFVVHSSVEITYVGALTDFNTDKSWTINRGPNNLKVSNDMSAVVTYLRGSEGKNLPTPITAADIHVGNNVAITTITDSKTGNTLVSHVVLLNNTPGPASASATPLSTQVSNPTPTATVTVAITNNGFSPENTTIVKGTQVIFENHDTVSHWPASDIHPTHGIYPEFDPKQEVLAGKSWSFVFNKIGQWRYHDHLYPTTRGIITVTAN